MVDREKTETLIKQHSLADFKWIDPRTIVVAQWVRVKCEFGCRDYGLGACPPNTPSVEACGRFFSEYETGLLFRLTTQADKNSYPSAWSKDMTARLLELERAVFLSGHQKTFLLNQACCDACEECPRSRARCRDKAKARPSPEAFAVDVYATARGAGFDINVISTNPSEINRIAILLIE
jgi:predicted metal-binding protein